MHPLPHNHSIAARRCKLPSGCTWPGHTQRQCAVLNFRLCLALPYPKIDVQLPPSGCTWPCRTQTQCAGTPQCQPPSAGRDRAWLSCSMHHLQQGSVELALAQQMCCCAHTQHTGKHACRLHLQAQPWHGSAATETSLGLAQNKCCCAHNQGASTQLCQHSSAGMAMACLSCGRDKLDFGMAEVLLCLHLGTDTHLCPL